MWRRLFFAGTAAGVVGCSLLLSSELEGNADPSGEHPNETGAGTNDAASTLDATAKDAESTDAGADATTKPTCPSFAFLCDDFESGGFAKWTSIVKTNSGEVTAVNTPARNAFAMRASAGLNPTDGSTPTSKAELSFIMNTAKTSGMIAVRSYVYMTKGLSSDTTFMKITADSNNDMNVKIHSTGVIKVDTDTAGAGADKLSTTIAPLNTWFCLEWQTTIGALGRQTLLLDGQTILDVAENTSSPVGFDTIDLGFNAAIGTLQQEVFFDDVALAEQPIGCF